MFAEAFLPNLLIFAFGQLVAWGYLRTGLVWRGALLLVFGWITADVALVARLAFDDRGWLFITSLLLMQTHALAEGLLFAFGRLRRRWPRWRRERPLRFREAVLAYLRNDLESAATIQRQLLRRDPWDFDATLALATVLARAGKARRARSLFRRARALDGEGRFADVIRLELERFAVRRAAPSAGSG